MSVADGLQIMRDPQAVVELAERVVSFIPDYSLGMEQLISSYSASSLAKFHCGFYSAEPYPPDTWPRTYDRTDLGRLPPCVRFILEHPNDLLLRPAGMRRIVIVFLSLGWHPVTLPDSSKFYSRVFAGLVAARYDDLIDFNCQSAREQQTCHVADCCQNLQPFKQSLLDRRAYERLACRPFHRLFLPA
jgi:hypothetical protein